MSTSTRNDPSAGAISFTVLAEIAVGANARIDLCRVTQAARPEIVGQLVAVKRLHPHLAEDPDFANQFLDEVWMTAALRHPNVVEVRGWGEDEQGSYLAVELVQGVPLGRLMKTVFETGEVFSERMVVFIGSRLCRGLSVAHALRGPDGDLLNLVHRDLTPSNVLVGFNGDVKIADFGMAKAKQRLTKTLTGLRKGEPGYMAPEQMTSENIDRRADLFALGVMLFELFAGRRPWTAKSDFELLQSTTKEPPADLRELRPKIDKELVNVVNRCLEKNPDARFQSANEVGERLENWLSSHGYQEGNEQTLARFIRRNAMRQMRWFERAAAGDLSPAAMPARPQVPTYLDTKERKPNRTEEAEPEADQEARRAAEAFAAEDSLLDEATDISSIADEARAMRNLQVSAGAPVILDKPDEGEWSEEIPTLVQKGSRAVAEVRNRAKTSSLTEVEPIPAALISEARARAASKNLPAIVGLPQGAEAPAPPRSGNAPESADSEAYAAMRADQQRRGLGLGGTVLMPAPPGSPNAAPPAAPPAPSAPAPTPQGPPRAAQGLAPSPPSGSLSAAPVSASPASPAGSARVPSSVDPRERGGQEGAFSERSITAEADRLATEAARRGEEAREAVQRAERVAAMAKAAADAAQVAADAVRLARSGGLNVAGARLGEAIQIEQTLDRHFPAAVVAAAGSITGGVGAPLIAPGSVHPPPGGSTLPSPGQLVGSATSPQGSPWAPAPPGDPSMQVQMPPGYPPGMQPSPPGASGNIPPLGAIPTGTGTAGTSAVYMINSFRAHLKSTVLGMPPLAIVGLAIVAFCIVFLLLFLFFG